MLNRLRRDDGITLVETLVTIVLFSAIGAMVLGGITSGMRATRTVQDQVDTSAKLQIAVERIARELRAADPVEVGTAAPNRLQVRILRNGVCTRMIYRLVGTDLVQYTQGSLTPAPAPVGSRTVSGACTTPAATEPPPAGLPTKVLVSGVPAGSTLFTYFDAAGATMPFGVSGGNQPREKDIVRIAITLRREVAGKKPLQAFTDVQLRNGVFARMDSGA